MLTIDQKVLKLITKLMISRNTVTKQYQATLLLEDTKKFFDWHKKEFHWVVGFLIFSQIFGSGPDLELSEVPHSKIYLK